MTAQNILLYIFLFIPGAAILIFYAESSKGKKGWDKFFVFLKIVGVGFFSLYGFWIFILSLLASFFDIGTKTLVEFIHLPLDLVFEGLKLFLVFVSGFFGFYFGNYLYKKKISVWLSVVLGFFVAAGLMFVFILILDKHGANWLVNPF